MHGSFWLKNLHTLSDEKLQQLEEILTAEDKKAAMKQITMLILIFFLIDAPPV